MVWDGPSAPDPGDTAQGSTPPPAYGGSAPGLPSGPAPGVPGGGTRRPAPRARMIGIGLAIVLAASLGLLFAVAVLD